VAVSGHSLVVYLAAAAVLAAVPGPAVLYIVSQSAFRGRRAGVVSTLGIAAGGLVHVAAAVAGLSALVVASATAFTAVKIAGAAYLVWLGIQALRAPPERIGGRRPERDLRRMFTQGMVVQALNPKTALFFLAFLPQFVDRAEPVRGQLALLGLLFVAIAFLSDLAWALAAGTAGALLRRSRTFLLGQRFVSGTVFIGLGITAAATGQGRG
jgi:threonine/homoserine/homoserine lactone efflux protein